MTGDAGTRARLPDLPARVGSFAVLRTLGEGASGVVVLAYDETFNHRVALKILYPRAGDSPELRERVIAGARTLMLLSHPNLARVHDVGEFQGQLYVATEFVPGITLSEWIEADSPSWDEVLDMYLQAGRGLAAAHAAGVLHGDFKPEHLMVRSDGRLLVIDFSPPRVTVIADSLPDGRVSVSSRELSISPRALDDAPEYMSPEQFLGHPCDARSEQFAYCAALWRGLMGERAFEGDSYDDRAHSVVNGRINAPPRRSLIPPWIVDVLRRGMSTSPADRYPSMDALVDALSIASSATVTRSRAARWLDPVIIGVLFCVISLALFKAINADFSIFPLPADTIAAEQIDASARAAREAAARRDWVYPRAGAPGDTALRHVLAIEQVKLKNAKDRAEALRRELAGQLRALGDVHWELEGGRGFARDFYLQALMFTREDESLLRRAGVSVGAQEELLEKAESGSFSTAELAAAEPLRILAEPDAGRRDEQLLEYLQRVDDLPGATRANLMALTGWGARAREPELGAATTGAGADAARVPAAPDEGATTSGADEADLPRDEPPDGVAPADVGAGEGDPPAPEETHAPEVDEGDGAALDPAEARKLSAQLRQDADAALDHEDFARAERLYKDALEADPRNHQAHHGLYALYFVRGEYGKARVHVRKAATLAPRRGRYRLDLGDLYLQAGDIEAARKAFKLAEKLGEVARAREQLARLPPEPGAG